MRRPRLLDLFCCEGCGASGYAAAGFDVVGVDIEPQPRYPYEFHRADALGFLEEHGHEFDAIHASPPCQEHSSLNRVNRINYGTGNLLPDTLQLLRSRFDDRPWVVENVQGAAAYMPMATLFCGSAFGLSSWRHRLFESNVLLLSPGCMHAGSRPRWERQARPGRPSVSPARRSANVGGGQSRGGGYTPMRVIRSEWRVGWTSEHGLREGIPPQYTSCVGEQLLAAVVVA